MRKESKTEAEKNKFLEKMQRKISFKVDTRLAVIPCYEIWHLRKKWEKTQRIFLLMINVIVTFLKKNVIITHDKWLTYILIKLKGHMEVFGLKRITNLWFRVIPKGFLGFVVWSVKSGFCKKKYCTYLFFFLKKKEQITLPSPQRCLNYTPLLC